AFLNRAFEDPGDDSSVSAFPNALVLYCPAFDGIDIWYVKTKTILQKIKAQAPSFLPRITKFIQNTTDEYATPRGHRANLIKLAETLGKKHKIDESEIKRFQAVLELFNKSDWQLLHPIEDAQKMSASRLLTDEPLPPTLIMFGDRDHLFEHQTAFVEKARKLGKRFELKIFKTAGHSFMTQPRFLEPSTREVENFFTKLAWLPRQERSSRLQTIAHRGSSADRPECTLASIRRAVEVGATAVEVDVRTTKDGRLVILHDATLDRTTNGTGKLQDKTLAEVRQLDAGSWFDPKYAGEKVPMLMEVLQACKDKSDLLLDLKEQGGKYAETVAAEVKRHGAPENIIIGVRGVQQARLFRKLLPTSRQLGLVPRPEDVESFAETGVEMIRLWPNWLKTDEALVGRLRKLDVKLHLNGSLGQPDEVRELLKHRPDSLSSDDPARLLRTLNDLQSQRE
ncbi:MAG: glycerophosphodiester phosphodiesterase family protein, partial [Planctomycetales bacterium]